MESWRFRGVIWLETHETSLACTRVQALLANCFGPTGSYAHFRYGARCNTLISCATTSAYSRSQLVSSGVNLPCYLVSAAMSAISRTRKVPAISFLINVIKLINRHRVTESHARYAENTKSCEDTKNILSPRFVVPWRFKLFCIHIPIREHVPTILTFKANRKIYGDIFIEICSFKQVLAKPWNQIIMCSWFGLSFLL